MRGRTTEKVAVWTSRDVQFALHPGTEDEAFERFFGTLPERYWDTWRHRMFGTLSIASHGLLVTVGAWPWWVPKWLARRSVAAHAAQLSVGGDARFVTERTVLAPRVTPPAKATNGGDA